MKWRERYDWSKVVLLLGSPIVAGALLALHYHYERPVPALWWIALFLYLLAQCSISVGYHRLYTHRTFKAHKLVHLFFLFFAPSAMQNSALKWCNDHRRHHAFTDEDADPHPVTRGFFYGHMGWVMCLDKKRHRTNMVKDLVSDPMILWQYKYYQLIFLFHLFVLPLAIGWYFGAPIGGLAIVGWCKALAGLHGTFFVNSAAHWFGSKTFEKNTSATDNPLVALVSFGEGYRNFHHAFPTDYRAGYFPASLDPGKWVIWTLSRVRLTWDLKRIDSKIIEEKIRAATA